MVVKCPLYYMSLPIFILQVFKGTEGKVYSLADLETIPDEMLAQWDEDDYEYDYAQDGFGGLWNLSNDCPR